MSGNLLRTFAQPLLRRFARDRSIPTSAGALWFNFSDIGSSQELEIQAKLNEKRELERIIELNNEKIRSQQQKLAELQTQVKDEEQKQEAYQLSLEEQKRREMDAKRLEELQRKAKEEEELRSRKARPKLSIAFNAGL